MISIDWDWIRKELSRRERIGDNAKASLDESIQTAQRLAVPKHASIEKKITRLDADGIEIEDGIRFLTKKIPPYIKGSEALLLFLVTIGDDIEKEASSLTSGADPLKGYLLDRIGSYAVELLADSLEKNMRERYAVEKRSLSNRFSPGYCDWILEEQFKISKILDFSKAGVILTEGCMMVPKKSISAMAAIADKGVFTNLGSTCSICDLKNCGYRRSA